MHHARHWYVEKNTGRPWLIYRSAQAYMKTRTPETQDKAWQMVKLMETVRVM